jgi:hypothetical protein
LNFEPFLQSQYTTHNTMTMRKLLVSFYAVATWLALNVVALSVVNERSLNRRDALVGISALGALSMAPKPALAKSDLSGFSDGPSGIKYLVTKEGEGEKAVRAQQVLAKYTLWTGGFGESGGTKVDSNTGVMGRPLPVIVGVGRVIRGWDIMLLDMKNGEARRLVIPSEVGYGAKGAGGKIPPYATLYFDVEIVDMDPRLELTEAEKKWLEENPF